MNNPLPPSSSRHDAADRAEVANEAALWLARRDRGFTAAERVQFEGWLAHPAHAQAWREIEGPFAALDRAARLRPRDGSTPDPDLLLAGSARRRPGAPLWLAGGIAAAAAVLVFGVLPLSGPVAPTPNPARSLVVRNAPERITLPDGSFIELKAGTRVEPAFTATERRVRLPGGEAHFVVAKDAIRPFVVVIDDVEVRAVGTAFTIHASAATVEVVVTEGRVRVDDRAGRTLVNLPHAAAADTPPLLDAGHFVVIPTAGPNRAPAPVQPATSEVLERSAAWRSAWLEFGDTPLADVVREFNRHGARHSNLILKLANEATGQVLVSGAFRADSAEAFVRLLESSFGITATPGTDGSVLLRRGP
jgi:transmembrane sensor